MEPSGAMDTWPAPVATRPVEASVRVPGSKSATNRALVLAALADGPSTIRGALLARDTRLMTGALASLGARIQERAGATKAHTNDVADDVVGRASATWDVEPGELHGGCHVDVGLAGTVMRFLPPVAALARGEVTFDGDQRARERPLGPILQGLRDLGVDVDDTAAGHLPITVRGTGSVRGGEASIDASASSQFVSGLLLSAARFDNGIALSHVGESLPSQPHIDMTIAMLAEHGVHVRTSGTSWFVDHGPIAAIDRVIEPDLSNAAPFLAAAMVTQGTVTIPHWPARTTQAGDALRGFLAEMGATVSLTAEGLTVTGPARILGLTADLHDVGELAPVMAAICAAASTPSHLSGIAHLRGHETDRLAALAEMLGACGGSVIETADGLIIEPAPLHGATLSSYDDHRMATAAAVLGLIAPGVRVEDIGTTAKTLPGFERMWQAMLGGDAA